jgi:alpha-N-arabinofuranosidase
VNKATVIVDDQPIGTISPRLYGHFIEHLGRCCYGGLRAGPDTRADAVDGFRRDVVEALEGMPVPLIRWPGGCFADHYHWRNGIGAPPSRPVTLGMSCGLEVPDDNSMGTHEFLSLCEMLGAEPYLAANVGSGTVQEMCDWVEYVNGRAETALTNERRANGRPDPWGVRLWGIGNESWDCGGRFDPVSYASEYRRYASMLRHVDPRAELVAVGMEDEPLPESRLDPEWNVKFLSALGPAVDLVDHLSVHRYWFHGGSETSFTEDDYYALLEDAAATESLVQRTARTLASAARPGHPIGIALDEYGVWHAEARSWGPGDVARRTPVTFEQAGTLRDALAVGIALEGFHRQCRVLSMANLAQMVNVLHSVIKTDGAACVRTPTYHAFALHKNHIGAEALQVGVEIEGAQPPHPRVGATASRQGRGTAVTLINSDYRHDFEVEIRADGYPSSAQVLWADSPDAANSITEPDAVSLKVLDMDGSRSGSCTVTMPAHSMATILFTAVGATGH